MISASPGMSRSLHLGTHYGVPVGFLTLNPKPSESPMSSYIVLKGGGFMGCGV